MNNELVVKIAKTHEKAIMPKQMNPGDAGFDLSSTERVDIPAGRSALINTGLTMEIPNGWCGQINPRSSLASKYQIMVGARVIDSGYRGEVKINIINHSQDTFEIVEGMRIAQILFLPVLTNIQEVSKEELTQTERGEGGFGSTGQL